MLTQKFPNSNRTQTIYLSVLTCCQMSKNPHVTFVKFESIYKISNI